MADIYDEPELGGSSGKFTEKVAKAEHRLGIGGVGLLRDRRKIRHDRNAVSLKGQVVTWHVSKDDRMEAGEAGDALENIYSMFGIKSESPSVLEAFNASLFFCHTINSGSVLQPGRSKLYVKREGKSGMSSEFAFTRVVDLLGVDTRRFFRAFADEIRVVNQAVLDGYTLSDPEAKERYDWLMEVAHQRNLARYPDLAHDSADKCSDLRPDERTALAASSVSVFSTIVNGADSLKANPRVLPVNSDAVPMGTAIRQ